MLLRLFLSLVLLILCTSCNFPRDPYHTLENVNGGAIRVGVVENQPWVKRINSKEPTGVEVNLVKQFAQELKANISWVWGDQENHLEALKEHELDLVIGGLTKSTPWQGEVGLTNPYYTENVVGVPPSQTPVSNIKKTQVAAKQGEVFAAYLEKKQAIPVRLKNPFEVNKPVAAPEWQLKKRGFKLTDIQLHKNQYVMAVPPGENGFLMRLENFLNKQTSQVKKMLQQEDVQS